MALLSCPDGELPTRANCAAPTLELRHECLEGVYSSLQYSSGLNIMRL